LSDIEIQQTLILALVVLGILTVPFLVIFCLLGIEYFTKSIQFMAATSKKTKVTLPAGQEAVAGAPVASKHGESATPSNTQSVEQTDDGTIGDRITLFLKAGMKPAKVKDIAAGLHLSTSYIEQTLKKKTDLFIRIDKEWGLKEWAKPSSEG
jgi:hypothetical protein